MAKFESQVSDRAIVLTSFGVLSTFLKSTHEPPSKEIGRCCHDDLLRFWIKRSLDVTRLHASREQGCKGSGP